MISPATYFMTKTKPKQYPLKRWVLNTTLYHKHCIAEKEPDFTGHNNFKQRQKTNIQHKQMKNTCNFLFYIIFWQSKCQTNKVYVVECFLSLLYKQKPEREIIDPLKRKENMKATSILPNVLTVVECPLTNGFFFFFLLKKFSLLLKILHQSFFIHGTHSYY